MGSTSQIAIALQRDALAEASTILQEPSKNTRRKILSSVNSIFVAIVFINGIASIAINGHLPDPMRDNILYPVAITPNLFSAWYNIQVLRGKREPALWIDRLTRWGTVLFLQVLSILLVHLAPNTATSIIFDNCFGMITIFVTGTILGRRAAVTWFLITLANLALAVHNRGSDFVFNLMTRGDLVRLHDLQIHDPAAFAQRTVQVVSEKLIPLPLILFASVSTVLSLLAMLATYFESGMIGNVLAALPQALDRIHLASKQKALLEKENMRLSTELEVAQRLQAMVLPTSDELLRAEGLEIAAKMKPATEIGGDLYDVLPMPDGSTNLVIGDVTDHGLASGVVMLMAQAAIRNCLEDVAASLTQTLIYVNSLIFKNVQSRMGDFRNLTLGLLRHKDGRLRIAGQHEAVILLRKGAPAAEVINTENLGFFVGMTPDIDSLVAETEVALEEGDLVLLYTDGATEAENAKKQQYGQERLIQALCAARHKPCQEIMNDLLRSVAEWIGSATLYDDITLLVARKK